jgi:N-acyl-D-amino-acid deacylase
MYDLLIRNGRIVDGTGNPWYRADIAIQDGKIIRIAKNINEDARQILDANDQIVSPGFCDLHTHSDYTIQLNHKALSTLHQGVTTEGVGQCGISVYGISEEYQPYVQAEVSMFGSSTAKQFNIDWTSLGEWRQKVEMDGIGINLAPYVGHGSIRNSIMGIEGKGGERYDPTPDEMDKMKALVRQAMEDGAFGLSSGLRYPWGRNSTTEEVVELCKIVAEYGGIYISHMRSEEDTLIEAVDELIRISEKANLPGCLTHHKALFRENWGKPSETMRMIDRARENGQEIICDFYPWTHSAVGNLGSLFAGYFGSAAASDEEKQLATSDLLTTIQNVQIWKKIKQFTFENEEKEKTTNELRKKELAIRGVKAPELWSNDTFNYIVASATHPEFVGLNLKEAKAKLGLPDYMETARKIYLDDQGATLAAGGIISEDDVITILKHPYSSISTDGAAFDQFADLKDPLVWAHPRNYGTFAKVFQRYVREMKLLRLEEVVRKMTSLPLGFLGIRDRGIIREGMWADITIFDPQTITNLATYANPCVYPQGIHYVIVNGQVAIREGDYTGALAGKVLRNN